MALDAASSNAARARYPPARPTRGGVIPGSSEGPLLPLVKLPLRRSRRTPTRTLRSPRTRARRGVAGPPPSRRASGTTSGDVGLSVYTVGCGWIPRAELLKTIGPATPQPPVANSVPKRAAQPRAAASSSTSRSPRTRSVVFFAVDSGVHGGGPAPAAEATRSRGRRRRRRREKTRRGAGRDAPGRVERRARVPGGNPRVGVPRRRAAAGIRVVSSAAPRRLRLRTRGVTPASSLARGRPQSSEGCRAAPPRERGRDQVEETPGRGRFLGRLAGRASSEASEASSESASPPGARLLRVLRGPSPGTRSLLALVLAHPAHRLAVALPRAPAHAPPRPEGVLHVRGGIRPLVATGCFAAASASGAAPTASSAPPRPILERAGEAVRT